MHSTRPPAPTQRSSPYFHRLTMATALSTLLGTAGATTLGPVVEQSALGEPLRIVIDLPGERVPDGGARCFAIVLPRGQAEGMAALRSAQMRVEPSAGGPRLLITSPRPVNDLALQFAIETVCTPGVHRDYTLLLDPPVAEVRAVAVVEAPAETAAPPTTPVAAVAPMRPRMRATPAREPAAAQPRVDAPAAASGAGKPSRAAQGGATRDRVVVSRTAATAPGDAAAVARELRNLKPDQQLAALQEQETVLGHRVAALTAEVQAVQRERIEQLTAEVARMRARLAELDAQGSPPRTPPPATAVDNATVPEWWSVAAVLGGLGTLAALIVAGMRWRAQRRRRGVGLVHGVEPEPPILSARARTVAPAMTAMSPPAPARHNASAPAQADGALPSYVEYLVLGGVPEDDARGQVATDHHLNLEFDEELMQTQRRTLHPS